MSAQTQNRDFTFIYWLPTLIYQWKSLTCYYVFTIKVIRNLFQAFLTNNNSYISHKQWFTVFFYWKTRTSQSFTYLSLNFCCIHCSNQSFTCLFNVLLTELSRLLYLLLHFSSKSVICLSFQAWAIQHTHSTLTRGEPTFIFWSFAEAVHSGHPPYQYQEPGPSLMSETRTILILNSIDCDWKLGPYP